MARLVAHRAFEAMVVEGKGDPRALARGIRHELTNIGLRALAAKLMHVAACEPQRMADVYDHAAAGWLGVAPTTASTRVSQAHPPSGHFWRAFWGLMATPAAARRRTPMIAQIARLAGLLDPRLNDQVAAVALTLPGIAHVAHRTSQPLDLASLGRYPPSSLAGLVAREVRTRGSAPELNVEALRLADLPRPLEHLNAAALHHHLVWAVVGGYGRTELDELGLAAFQVAQFGHHYSALVIALAAATIAFERPPGVELVLDAIFQGWAHGRRSPLLLLVDWEDLWALTPAAVRERLHISPFASPAVEAALRLNPALRP